jgi:NAD(P)-dependent dehydrogenase (short-subunit alcohol dehydrogenase family)
MRIELTDQVALVTGAAHRVGKAIALALAKEGVHLLIHYHSASDDAVRDTLHEIKSYGVDAFAVAADISTVEGVETVLAALRENFGRLHILVNSASVFPTGNLLEIPLADWDRTMNINLRAPFLLTQHAAPLMQANQPAQGVIINICDRGVDRAWVQRPHHGISKAALWALTQVSALSLAPAIRVNAIIPGPVLKTNDGMSDETWERIGLALPLRITGNSDDVGRAVVYLAGESFITGALIHVNGGEHL